MTQLEIVMFSLSPLPKRKIDQRVLTDILPGIGAFNKGATAGEQSASFNLGTTGSPLTVTKDGAGGTTSVIDLIVDMGTVLDEANAPEADRFLVSPDFVRGMLAALFPERRAKAAAFFQSLGLSLDG